MTDPVAVKASFSATNAPKDAFTRGTATVRAPGRLVRARNLGVPRELPT